MNRSDIGRLAALQSVINAVISGLQAWFAMKSQVSVAVTLDSISGGSRSVLGKSVAAAFFLGFAVTCFTYLGFRKRVKEGAPRADINRLKFWPDYVELATKNAVFVFGVLTILAILWQYWIGTLFVTPLVGVLLTALIAATQTAYVSYSTMVSMLQRSVLAEPGE